MRPISAAILLAILVFPYASAVLIDSEGVKYGADGPSDYYRHVSSNTAYYYNAATRVLTPAPTFTTTEPIYLLGRQIEFWENGDEYPGVLAPVGEDMTCQSTVCMSFEIREVGDKRVHWRYNYTAKDPLTGLYFEVTPSTPWKEILYLGAGKPFVTGGAAFPPGQNITGTDCIVNAEMRVIDVPSNTPALLQRAFYCGS